MARVARPVVPVAGDAAIIAERIVERPAVEAEVLRLGLAHGVQQLEAGDIGVALGGHQRDLRVQQLLLGIEHVEDGAGADALLGAGAFERELVGLDRDGLGLDRLLRRLVGGEGGAGRLDDRALGADDLLQHLALERLRLADARRGQAALEDRHSGAETPTLVAVPASANAPLSPPMSIDIGRADATPDSVGRRPARATLTS